MIDEVSREAGASRGKLTAQVKTAVPLTAETEKRLEEVLSKLAGQRVFLKTSVDPTLLGGVVVRLGGRIIDGSVKGRLDRLRAVISKGLRA